MITNPSIIKEKYKCNKNIANYLIFKCNIPLLGVDKDYYYFANTDKLKECVKNMPLGLKILSIIAGWIY
jgi:hypothetical protein